MHFNVKSRVQVDLDKLQFKILNDLFAEGDKYIEDLNQLKAQGKALKTATAAGIREPKRRKSDALREKDPW